MGGVAKADAATEMGYPDYDFCLVSADSSYFLHCSFEIKEVFQEMTRVNFVESVVWKRPGISVKIVNYIDSFRFNEINIEVPLFYFLSTATGI